MAHFITKGIFSVLESLCWRLSDFEISIARCRQQGAVEAKLVSKLPETTVHTTKFDGGKTKLREGIR